MLLFMLLSLNAMGQTKKDSLAGEYLIQVRQQIGDKNYSDANYTLKKLFALKTVLPDEVAFRLGQIQLGLNNYTKAKEAFKKYIELTDGKGEYVEESKVLLDLAEAKICKKCNNTGMQMITDTCAFCKGVGKLEVSCEACQGKGIEYCPTCKGQGVVYKSSAFGGVYQTCNQCSGKGITKCRRCGSSGKETSFCEHCKGRGTIVRSIICEHK